MTVANWVCKTFPGKKRVVRASAAKRPTLPDPPWRTPDGRYIIVRGRLWRASNPGLPEAERAQLVRALMAGRRAVRDAKDNEAALRAARARIDAAKVELGERGPVWWDDGAPYENRKLAKNSSYARWYAGMTGGSYARGACRR